MLAGDTLPIDVYCHIPIMCEDRSLPYAYVPSKSVRGWGCTAGRIQLQREGARWAAPERHRPGAWVKHPVPRGGRGAAGTSSHGADAGVFHCGTTASFPPVKSLQHLGMGDFWDTTRVNFPTLDLSWGLAACGNETPAKVRCWLLVDWKLGGSVSFG